MGKSGVEIECKNNGKVAEQRPIPGLFLFEFRQENISLEGCLSTSITQSSRNTRFSRDREAARPTGACAPWLTIALRGVLRGRFAVTDGLDLATA